MLPHSWQNGIRDDVMWEVLQEKFAQDLYLMQLLKATESAYLLGHSQMTRDRFVTLSDTDFIASISLDPISPENSYWNDNNDGTGKNMLGQMLMAIRDGKPKPPVDIQDLRMQAHTMDINQKIATDSLGYTMFKRDLK